MVKMGAKGRGLLRRLLVALAGAAVVCLYIHLYVNVFQLELPKTARLRAENKRWQQSADLIDRQMDVYDEALQAIESRDNDVYRTIYGLPDVGEDMKYLLSQEDSRYSYLDKEGASPLLKRLVRRCDAIDRRISLQGGALDEIAALAVRTGDMVACVPNIPPICPEPGKYHVSSRFGYRTDPVYGGKEYHSGIDFAARRGTAVYATGDGVVSLARYRIRGYGNEIVIDHGYGYHTRYAHLSAIDVAEGMKVSRGQRIGAVGNSGKSTGPHLHYEVVYKGTRVNPRNYMDLAMNVSEYRQMTADRERENPEFHRKSTSDILKRRK